GKALQGHRRPPACELQDRLQYLQSVKNQAQRKYVRGAEARRDPVPTFGYSSTCEASGSARGGACDGATPSSVLSCLRNQSPSSLSRFPSNPPLLWECNTKAGNGIAKCSRRLGCSGLLLCQSNLMGNIAGGDDGRIALATETRGLRRARRDSHYAAQPRFSRIRNPRSEH